jgi:hypothetical protein
MFTFIVRTARAAWDQVVALCTQAAECVRQVVRGTAVAAAAGRAGARPLTIEGRGGVYVNQAPQAAQQQGPPARTLADRLVRGTVAFEEVDAAVAAYEAYRAHAAEWLAVPDLPSAAYLRRAGKTAAIAQLLSA